MNSILRKTLVAAAVAGTCGANAAVISSDDRATTAGIQQVISSQGLAIAKSITTSATASNTTIRVGLRPQIDAYAASDLLRFTITGAKITSGTSQSGVTLQYNNNGTMVTVADALNIDKDTGVVTLGLTDNNPATADVDNILITDADSQTYYLVGVGLQDIDASTGIGIDFAGRRQQEDIDAADAVVIAQVGTQWSYGSATADYNLDATIDVEANRSLFVDAATSASDFFNSVGQAGTAEEANPTKNDSFAVTVGVNSHLLTATATRVTHALTTDTNFDWTLASNGDYRATSAAGVSSAAVTSVVDSLSTDKTTLNTVVTGANSDKTTTTVTLTVPGDIVLPESKFNLSSTVGYFLGNAASNDTAVVGTKQVGNWGLSGATRLVEFMPYGTGISNFIYVSNTSTVDAEIELVAYEQGGTAPVMCGVLSVTAAPQAVTNLGVSVNTALAACGLGNSGDRLSLSFTINAPDAAIDLTAGYNSRGDRVLID